MSASVSKLKKHPNIIRGNRADLLLKLLADGQPFSNLSSAIGGRFVALNRKTKTTAIDKELADMTVDDPETGTVRIGLSSVDTDIDEGRYDIAVQFSWGGTDILEWNFPESLVILKGIIPSS